MAVVDQIVSALVPQPSVTAPPPGATVVEQRLRGGVPATIPLSQSLALAVVLPTGLAVTWRDADATTLVSAGRFEHDPALVPDWPTGVGSAGRPPLWLVLLEGSTGSTGRRPVAATAAAVGVSRRLPASGRVSVGVSVTVLDWELFAGTVVGAQDAGSWVRLAWRLIGAGAAPFDAPPVARTLRSRSRRADSSVATGPAAADPAGYGPTPAATTLRDRT